MNIDYYYKRLLSSIKNFFKNSDAIIDFKQDFPSRYSSKISLIHVRLGAYSYLASNSSFRNTTIGRFCSIGSNVMCGLAIHPTNGFSTSPIFYSNHKQCGVTLTQDNLIDEYENVTIENDVFIGSNCTILSGIHIGNGAVVAAGSVVVKDVPPYAIVGGVPARVLKYRFDETTINKMLESEWWNKPIEDLMKIPENFFDPIRALESISVKQQ